MFSCKKLKSTNKSINVLCNKGQYARVQRAEKDMEGAYRHLTEKSGWGVGSIMVSDLPVLRGARIPPTVRHFNACHAGLPVYSRIVSSVTPKKV